MTRLRAGQPRNPGSIIARVRDLYGAYAAFCFVHSLYLALNLTTHFRLFPKVRMSGIILWFLHTPSWLLYLYLFILSLNIKVKVKWSRYRPGVAQRVGRGIALLFHDHGTRREWVVSSTPRSNFTPGKDPVPIVQEAGWATGPVWAGGKFRPHRDSIPDLPARIQSLYRLSYPSHGVAQRVPGS